jgi:hypothetical protein
MCPAAERLTIISNILQRYFIVFICKYKFISLLTCLLYSVSNTSLLYIGLAVLYLWWVYNVLCTLGLGFFPYWLFVRSIEQEVALRQIPLIASCVYPLLIAILPFINHNHLRPPIVLRASPVIIKSASNFERMSFVWHMTGQCGT